MDENSENSNNSTVERSRSNIFDQLATGSIPEKSRDQADLQGIYSAIKDLSKSVAEIRGEVNNLKRPVDKADDFTGQSCSKRACQDSGESDSESSVSDFFQEEEAPQGEMDEFCVMDFFENTEEAGVPISDKLAAVTNKALRSRPKEEKIKQIVDTYKRPNNVDFLQVPTVNEQLWRQLQPSIKSHDYILQKSHKTLATALVPVLKAMDILKTQGHSQVRELVNDTFKILTNAISGTTQARRERIKKELLPIYRPVGKMEPSATLLFGDKMEDEIKKMKDTKLQMTTKKPFLGKRMSSPAQASQKLQFQRNRNFATTDNNNYRWHRPRQQNGKRTMMQKKHLHQKQPNK